MRRNNKLQSSIKNVVLVQVTTVTDSLNNLSVQCEDGDDKSKLSKAQRRRDKKQTQLKERELRIAEQEVSRSMYWFSAVIANCI